jgi:hypothetical protein
VIEASSLNRVALLAPSPNKTWCMLVAPPSVRWQRSTGERSEPQSRRCCKDRRRDFLKHRLELSVGVKEHPPIDRVARFHQHVEDLWQQSLGSGRREGSGLPR